MIVPALLRGSTDFRHFLGGGRVGGAILTCMLYFLLVRRLIVHSEQVNVYLFWTVAA